MKYLDGSNRKKSMQYGLVIPVCRICHCEYDVNKEIRQVIQQEAKKAFENRYSKEIFLKEFGKNYCVKNRGGN